MSGRRRTGRSVGGTALKHQDSGHSQTRRHKRRGAEANSSSHDYDVDVTDDEDVVATKYYKPSRSTRYRAEEDYEEEQYEPRARKKRVKDSR